MASTQGDWRWRGLYQQNHCGIYRIDRPGDTWVRIGRAMPKSVGDIGFPLVAHPRGRPTTCESSRR